MTTARTRSPHECLCRMRRENSMNTPALRAWREELRRGERTPATFDALWRAACEEANALEFASIPELAACFQREARRIILEAAKQQRGEAA